MPNQPNRVAIFERAQNLTLNSDHIVALAQVALQSLDRDRQILSSCQCCGGKKYYDSETRAWVYDHAPSCAVETIESIERLHIEDD